MSENAENPQDVVISPPKRGRGRPKGSKTKVVKSVLPVNPAIKIHLNDDTEVLPLDKTIVVNNDKDAPKSKLERLTAILKGNNNTYDTLDAAEYRNRIDHMSLNDIQDECMKVGLKPNVTIETKNITIGTLMELFNENKKGFLPDESGQNQTVLTDDKRMKLTELMKNAR